MVCALTLLKLKIFSLRIPPKNKKYTNSAAREKRKRKFVYCKSLKCTSPATLPSLAAAGSVKGSDLTYALQRSQWRDRAGITPASLDLSN